MRAHTLLLIIAAMVAALSAPPVAGQSQPPVEPSPTRQASFERTSSSRAVHSVQFGSRPARVGDTAEQNISLQVNLATSLRQANELIEQNRSTVRNEQRRVVTTTEVDQGRTLAVLVRYQTATKEVTVRNATEDENGAAEPKPTVLPVQGKSYRCRREPGDEGELVITDEDGNIPPLEEFQFVAQSMEMVGRTNPLVQLLAGRKIGIGETVQLPKNIADQVFNLGEDFGEVARFDLTLEKLDFDIAVPCAVFQARVEAASSDSSQMRLHVQGRLIVEINTCRPVETHLSGPIAMSETRGSYSIAYQLIGTGKLQMRIRSTYGDSSDRR